MIRIDDLRAVSRAILARVFRCSGPNINAMVSRGMPKREDGGYDLFDCVGWRLDELAMASGTAETAEAKKWLTRYRKSRALRDELAHKREAGELISVADNDQKNAEKIRLLTHGLNALCDRLPPLLIGKTRDAISETIEDEVELLMHAFRRHGRYDKTSASAILVELGGKTNRQKRLEKIRAHFPKEKKTDEEKTA